MGRWYRGDSLLWPFGFGLSYSQFKVEWADSSMFPPHGRRVPIATMASLHASYYKHGRQGSTSGTESSYLAMVTNVGSLASDYVLLGFVTSNHSDAPIRKLFDFARVSLEPGESTTVQLSVPAQAISITDVAG